MSSVGVMTFLHNGNYGSSLQAYALQRVLSGMGNECEHIDYRPDTAEKIRNLLRCGNSFRRLLEGGKKRRVQAERTGIQEKYRRIQSFYDRRMKLSPVCRNSAELRKLEARYDILVCGSDQIWNPIWLNPAYYLDFASPDRKRAAYAASLGVSVVPGRRKQKMIRKSLESFHAISVREEDGARIIASITGKRPDVMPDPVCLLTRDEWSEIAEPPVVKSGYLLCYFIGENPEYWNQAAALCRKNGLTPLILPVTEEAYRQKEGCMLDAAGPEQFLGAVQEADEICTDSFHGLAFGTIFEKKVHLIRRDKDTSRESKNSRTDHFLEEIKSKGLTKMRAEGLSWLKENLNEERK